MGEIFVGVHDIAAGKVGSLRNPNYRRKYENAYREDLRRYGRELTLEIANKKLIDKEKGLRELSMRPRKQVPLRPLPKDMVLMLNHLLVTPNMVDPESTIDDPRELGRIAEILYAERLPSIRLWLHYKDYVMGVVPDGLTDSYAYEFKATTLRGREAEEVKDQAVRQAQLYAYAFERPSIKIQIAQFQLSKVQYPLKVKDLSKPDVTTILTSASSDEALDILTIFDMAFRESETKKAARAALISKER